MEILQPKAEFMKGLARIYVHVLQTPSKTFSRVSDIGRGQTDALSLPTRPRQTPWHQIHDNPHAPAH